MSSSSTTTLVIQLLLTYCDINIYILIIVKTTCILIYDYYALITSRFSRNLEAFSSDPLGNFELSVPKRTF